MWIDVSGLPLAIPAASCDPNLSDLTNCVATITETWTITKNITMHNVVIQCLGPDNGSCVSLEVGYSLQIHEAEISGSLNGNFITCAANSTLIMTNVDIRRFGGPVFNGSVIESDGAEHVKIFLNDCHIHDNMAIRGVIMATGTVASPCCLHIINSAIYSNFVQAGSISCQYCKSSWLVNTAIYDNNCSSDRGCGTSLIDSVFTIVSCRYSHNSATKGGAVYIGHVDGSTMHSNINIIDSTFEKNVAAMGKDIYCNEGDVSDPTVIKMIGSCIKPDSYDFPNTTVCKIE